MSNAVRPLTRGLLGVALGRSLFVHVRKPLPAMRVWQTVLVTALTLPVILATYLGPKNG